MTTTTETTYAVGDRVIYRGEVAATVVRCEGNDTILLRFGRDLTTQQRVRYGWRGGNERGTDSSHYYWFVTANELTPAQPTEPQNSTHSGSDLLADLRTIGEHLKATAERLEWCGEYETHLSRLCDALSEEGAEALRSTAQRVRSFTVSYTITVEGSNRAEAIANAQREAQSGSGHWGASERDSNG